MFLWKSICFCCFFISFYVVAYVPLNNNISTSVHQKKRDQRQKRYLYWILTVNLFNKNIFFSLNFIYIWQYMHIGTLCYVNNKANTATEQIEIETPKKRIAYMFHIHFSPWLKGSSMKKNKKTRFHPTDSLVK